MGKISPIAAKYIIHTNISIEGVVDKPDVIGAVFGQTEGLLGNELELRELQRSGRIGRIEVKLETRSGKTSGEIIIPSSLDKAETAIIGAALETIQRIGPCDSKLDVILIEDVRISKRNQVIERAKELLRELTSKVLPDSQDITDQVAQSVRMMEIIEYGRERLAAGPAIDESEEIIVVEGRADVLNLLKQGIKNVIALNGTSIPDTIKFLSKKKVLTLFVDGDRGGDLIIRGLIDAGVEIDYVVKAPDGKEVEEITKKEIHKALRSKVAIEQIKMDLTKLTTQDDSNRNNRFQPRRQEPARQDITRPSQAPQRPMQTKASPTENKKFKELLDDLVGTRAAYFLDNGLNILGKVPVTELESTIKNINAYALVFDGIIDRNITSSAERSSIQYIVGMTSRINPRETRINILTQRDLS
jgi:DNA primase